MYDLHTLVFSRSSVAQNRYISLRRRHPHFLLGLLSTPLYGQTIVYLTSLFHMDISLFPVLCNYKQCYSENLVTNILILEVYSGCIARSGRTRSGGELQMQFCWILPNLPPKGFYPFSLPSTVYESTSFPKPHEKNVVLLFNFYQYNSLKIMSVLF